MKPLDYGSLMEPWKADLIVSRAKRMGFRCDEIEDVQQEIIIDVVRFRYEAAKSNGASEATALTALIDNRLKKFVRTQARYRARLELLRHEAAPEYEQAAHDELRIDVETVVASLPEKERRVCRALGSGLSRHEIARTLGCGWHTVDRIVRRIRKRFEECGLDAWVQSR